MALRVSHISLQQQNGGAAIAALRIHHALRAHGERIGVNSRLRVRYGPGGDPSIEVGPSLGSNPLWLRMQPRLTTLARRGFAPAYPITHSIAWPSTGLGQELTRSGSDLIHLHWLGDQMLSIEEIGALPQPLVWTLHDQWAFCGAEHYEMHSHALPRYSHGYLTSNRPAGEYGPDLCRRTWERKRRSWRRPFNIVCPSQWLASCVRRSVLMGDWPVSVIPHPIDTELWRPIGRQHARAALGLPCEGPILAFGAMGGTQVPHKGGDLLLQALHDLSGAGNKSGLADLRLIVFGQAEADSPLPLPVQTHYFGILHDPISMRLIYSAADIVVVPSRIEAFGQVALEAQACGTSVVAFAVGGLLDIVADRTTGALAAPFDSYSLASAISWILAEPERATQLGQEGRKRVLRMCDQEVVSSEYAKLYHSIITT